MQSLMYSGRMPGRQVSISVETGTKGSGDTKKLEKFCVAASLLTAILLCGTGQHLFAATEIRGDISQRSFSKAENPYRIVDDIFIPENKKVVIPAGVVFLFSDLTGFKVAGRVSIEGTMDEPVVFSSINDKDFLPGASGLTYPDDWNGIFIARQTDSVFFHHCKVAFSTSGITSECPDIKIDNCTFIQNSKNLEIDGKIVADVKEGEPFSYTLPEKLVALVSSITSPCDSTSVSPFEIKKIQTKAVSSVKIRLEISFAAIAAVSAISAIVLHSGQQHRAGDIKKNDDANIIYDRTKAINDRNRVIAWEGFCWGITGSALLGCGLTVVF